MTDFYLPKPLANGICIHQIALTLKEMGYEIHISSFKMDRQLEEENYEGIYIHRVKPRLFFKLRSYGEDNVKSLMGQISYKLAMFINKFKKILYLPFYPITSPLFIWRYYRRVNLLHRKYKFDTIISVYNPIEALVCGFMMKKKYNSVKWGIYVLDSLSNGLKIKFLSEGWLDKKGWKWEKIFYSYSDKVFNIKCHQEHHSKERYNTFRTKMEIVDIPLFRSLQLNYKDYENIFDNKYINLVYTGALSFELRNPKYLCDSFVNINSNRLYRLHFYSRGNCETMIEEYQRKTEGLIIRYGYVEMQESMAAICAADILISVGNRNSDMIPSKTFEYMSTGKKIIHFYTSLKDSSLPYFKKYPNALLINENEDFQLNSERIKKFVDEGYIPLKFNEIADLFIENTPEFTSRKIDEMLS
jgi:hypothetical protein